MAASLLPLTSAEAGGGLGLSGSFYRQDFVVPQGSAVNGPEDSLVVFNSGDSPLLVRMTSVAPTGVELIFSVPEFTLPASGRQSVAVAVRVGLEVTPGVYEVTAKAESYRDGATGIQIAGGVAQTARLTVLGEAGQVNVRALSPEGAPLVASVRLFRLSNGQQRGIGSSDTGVLDLKVAPGDFLAALYVGGEKRAEETFSVAANEVRNVNLTAATVYFETFSVVPAYETASGKLAFLKIVYTVRNLYGPVSKAEVTLRVTRDGQPLENVPLASLGPLEVGRVSLNYSYIPAGGWVPGKYGFTLALDIDGKAYAVSNAQEFDAGQVPAAGTSVTAGAPRTGEEGKANNWPLIGSVVAGLVVVGGGAWLVGRGRRKA